jgi:hypothetical protein
MTDIVKGMAIAGWDAGLKVTGPGVLTADIEQAKMRAALLWLADQFETNKALRTSIKIQEAPGAFSIKVGIEDDIAAAIRAAAGGEG